MFACRRCDEQIARDAEPCPECGYDPAGTAKDVAAILLGLSVPALLAFPPVGVLGLFVGVLLFGWGLLASPATRVA
ncbi:hypothetical protein [Halovivax sp.]|uniref:hypothetical protein n=1 Tax=Halovivax sp. TaxID=1935978 RepID=UPI0025BB8131|nr:hypothetical protein [Halovivax sp.]